MSTNYYNAKKDYENAITIAVESLKNGGVIIFPTETVYGLGCDIFNDEAVKKLYDIKKRSLSQPLSAHCSSIDMIESVCEEIPSIFYRLAAIFLPGPLAVILKKKSHVSDLVTSGKDSLAVRIPENKTALDIIKNFGRPVAGTSANLSKQKSNKTVLDFPPEFTSKIDCIIDDGLCKYGFESTIISLIDKIPTIVRQGVISRDRIDNLLGFKTN